MFLFLMEKTFMSIKNVRPFGVASSAPMAVNGKWIKAVSALKMPDEGPVQPFFAVENSSDNITPEGRTVVLKTVLVPTTFYELNRRGLACMGLFFTEKHVNAGVAAMTRFRDRSVKEVCFISRDQGFAVSDSGVRRDCDSLDWYLDPQLGVTVVSSQVDLKAQSIRFFFDEICDQWNAPSQSFFIAGDKPFVRQHRYHLAPLGRYAPSVRGANS